MNERDMQGLFKTYIEKNPPNKTEIYEFKIEKSKSWLLSKLRKHQEEALLNSQFATQYHKLTDQPWIKNRSNVFTLKKPFDAFVVNKVDSFVVLWFYKPRKRKIFYKILIENIVILKESFKRKSITEEHAKDFGIPLFIR